MMALQHHYNRHYLKINIYVFVKRFYTDSFVFYAGSFGKMKKTNQIKYSRKVNGSKTSKKTGEKQKDLLKEGAKI